MLSLSLILLFINSNLISLIFSQSYRPTIDDVLEWQEGFNALPTDGSKILSLLSDDVVLCLGDQSQCIMSKAEYEPLVQIQEDVILADNGHQSFFDINNIYYGDGYFLIESASEYCEDYKGCSVLVDVTYLMFYNSDGLIERWYEMPHDYDLFFAWVAHAFDNTGTVQCPTGPTNAPTEEPDDR